MHQLQVIDQKIQELMDVKRLLGEALSRCSDQCFDTGCAVLDGAVAMKAGTTPRPVQDDRIAAKSVAEPTRLKRAGPTLTYLPGQSEARTLIGTRGGAGRCQEMVARQDGFMIAERKLVLRSQGQGDKVPCRPEFGQSHDISKAEGTAALEQAHYRDMKHDQDYRTTGEAKNAGALHACGEEYEGWEKFALTFDLAQVRIAPFNHKLFAWRHAFRMAGDTVK